VQTSFRCREPWVDRSRLFCKGGGEAAKRDLGHLRFFLTGHGLESLQKLASLSEKFGLEF
jgi:hypothetical protein